MAQPHVICRNVGRDSIPLNKKYLDQCIVHNLEFKQPISSTAVRQMNPYPYWPLVFINNRMLLSYVSHSVYSYMMKEKLYGFSRQNLVKIISCRVSIFSLFMLSVCTIFNENNFNLNFICKLVKS
jgi:hypothetical protein